MHDPEFVRLVEEATLRYRRQRGEAANAAAAAPAPPTAQIERQGDRLRIVLGPASRSSAAPLLLSLAAVATCAFSIVCFNLVEAPMLTAVIVGPAWIVLAAAGLWLAERRLARAVVEVEPGGVRVASELPWWSAEDRFAREHLVAAHVALSERSMASRPVWELRLQCTPHGTPGLFRSGSGRPQYAFFAGRKREELEWLAATLRRELGLSAEPPIPPPPPPLRTRAGAAVSPGGRG